MIKGIGTDLVSIDRIDSSLERYGEKFAKRILSSQEFESFLTHPRAGNYLAKRFAAKEAVSKALGTGFAQGVSWQDIQIVNLPSGKPTVLLSGGALKVFEDLGAQQIFLSLSDELPFIQAYVVIE